MSDQAMRSSSPVSGWSPVSDGVLPRQFGKYTLLSRLSSGGMAEIFLALQRSVAGFEKLVVIKRIRPEMTQDRSFVDMLLHEARVAATLSHPNIVQTFDAGEIEGAYFIAMEHVHGADVLALLRRAREQSLPRLPLEQVLSIMIGVCAGLSYMHDRRDLAGEPLGIVHRDISPRNIVVSFHGDVKIVDFGIAKSAIEEPEEPGERPLKGKLAYLSPEQIRGETFDRRADIFAAGVVLFELTTGQRLFRGGGEVETLLQIRDGEYARPSDVAPGYPPALERVVARALQKRPADRYPSARQMQEDLEQFGRDERLAVSAVGLESLMQTLFADELARHKEALLGVRQLVDVIAAQQRLWMAEAGSGATTSVGVTSDAGPPSARLGGSSPPGGWLSATRGLTSAGATAIPVASALALVGGFVYMNHEMSRHQEEILRMYREEHALRQPPAAPADARGALEITSKPEGCTIWLNGDLRPEVTPAKLADLPLGRELHVKLTKDGFETFRTSAKLSEDRPFDEIEAELSKSTATVLLRVEPVAAVWVDGKMWKGERTKVDGLSPGEEHAIVLAANGYAPRTLKVTAHAGETKSFTLALSKVEPPAAASDAPQRGPLYDPFK
jgi:serine/threonine-protein kinase